MIFSSIKNLSENDFGQKYMAYAAEFLSTHNLDELPLGKTEIDGDNVFVNVMEFEPQFSLARKTMRLIRFTLIFT